jgi:hypothetical protein
MNATIEIEDTQVEDAALDRILASHGTNDSTVTDENLLASLVGNDPEMIAGIKVRNFVFTDWSLLKKRKNEIICGKAIADIEDAVYTALEILYVMSLAPKAAAKTDTLPVADFRAAVLEFGSGIPLASPSDLIAQIYARLGDAVSTRVTARVPDSMKATGKAASEGNG